MIKLRKGTVFIFTGEYPSDYFIDYLARELPNLNKQIIKAHRMININGYNLKVMKYPDGERTRGYRPEFIYYIGDGNIKNYNRPNKQIERDTKIKSTKKNQ